MNNARIKRNAITLILLSSVLIAGCVDSPYGTTEVQTETPPASIPETDNNGNLSSKEIRELELLIFEKTNQVRSDREKAQLSWNEDLAKISDYHAWNMAEKGFKSHIGPDGDSPNDRLNKFGYMCATDDLGEVISIGFYWGNYTVARSAEKAISSWMESDAHRAGILADGGRLAGVGAYNDASGEIFIVQMFCSNVEPLPSSQDRSSVGEDGVSEDRK